MSNDVEAIPEELVKVVAAARTLFRLARYPRCDASWPELKARLKMIEVLLRGRKDLASMMLHQEVLHFLGYRKGHM